MQIDQHQMQAILPHSHVRDGLEVMVVIIQKVAAGEDWVQSLRAYQRQWISMEIREAPPTMNHGCVVVVDMEREVLIDLNRGVWVDRHRHHLV